MLTTNLRTHWLLLKDGRKFAVTQDQYMWIKSAKSLSKISDTFELRDVDNWKMLFDWEYREIKEWVEINHWDSSKNFICGFGNPHPIQSSCGCSYKYWVPEWKFRQTMIDLFAEKQIIKKIVWGKDVEVINYSVVSPQNLSYKQKEQVIDHIKNK